MKILEEQQYQRLSALKYMWYVERWGCGLLRVSASLVNNRLGPLEVIKDVVDIRVNVRKRVVAEKVPIDDILSPLALPSETKRHVMWLFEWFGSGTVLGGQHIVSTLQLKD